MLWLINWQQTLVAKDRPNYDIVPKTNSTSKRDQLAFIKLNRAIQLPFDESHKGSLKLHLYQEAKKNINDDYQISILANKKVEKETTLEVGLNEFRATNDTGYCYATADELLTPTNDIRQAVLCLASQSDSFNIECSLTNDWYTEITITRNVSNCWSHACNS